jgi:hypothetical protein
MVKRAFITRCNKRVNRGTSVPKCAGKSGRVFSSFAYSALASFLMGMSGSASFPRARKPEKGNLFLAQKIKVGVTAGSRTNDCRKVLGKSVGATPQYSSGKLKGPSMRPEAAPIVLPSFTG